MKLAVIHKDGAEEILTLTEPLTIIRGKGFNRLVTSTGMEHWFYEDTGRYDGWGMAVNFQGKTHEEAWGDAKKFIDEIEDGRETPESPKR